MRLFRVDYLDDCDFETYLTVGNSLQEVEEREAKRLENRCSCFMNCYVFEIDKVDGHKIIIEEKCNGDKTDV